VVTSHEIPGTLAAYRWTANRRTLALFPHGGPYGLVYLDTERVAWQNAVPVTDRLRPLAMTGEDWVCYVRDATALCRYTFSTGQETRLHRVR
jgi:hypothetical protein